MLKLLFCRYADCQASFELVSGRFPAECPVCCRAAMWSTAEGNTLKPQKKRPRVPFDVTHQDYRLFLKRIKIKPD